jgi:methyl-accepting chemotaxis protein
MSDRLPRRTLLLMALPGKTRPARRPRRKGLLGQLLLRTILPAAAVLAALAGLSCWNHYQNRLAVSKAVLHESAQAVANWLDVKNREGIGAATLIAGIQRGGLFGQRKVTIGSLRTAIEDLPQISGICIAYEPMPEAKRASPEEPVAEGPPAAVPEVRMVRFVAGWYRDPGSDGTAVQRSDTGMELGPSYVALKSNWDSRGIADPIVSEPVPGDGGMTVQYACPIVTNDRFYGALQVERRLSDLRSEIEPLAQGGRVDIVVVSPGGRVIAASNGTARAFASDPANWAGQALAATDGARTISRVLAMGAAAGASALDDAAARGRSFYSLATAPTGGWTVVVSVAESTVVGPIHRDMLRTAGFAACGIAVIAVAAFIPTRRLVRRLNDAVRVAQDVASGNLSRAPSGSGLEDETGDLLRALDSMTEDLNALVLQVREATSSIAGTASELVAGSGRQEHAVQSFGASSAEVAAALHEITATGRELSREMTHVNEVAIGTAGRAQGGRAQLEKMEVRMKSLGEATDGVVERLGAINERAANIAGVITMIAKVAEQTNLLSVNAAIEAEKAGEFGRGFLVVAREIRRLADQTALAALDIERIVREMEAAVASGAMEMDRFGDQVRRSVAEARDLRQGVNEVIVSIEESTRSFGTVQQGMSQQAIGAAQISGAMSGLQANADASAEAARESTRAAEALHRSIRTLDTAVSAFRLRG